MTAYAKAIEALLSEAEALAQAQRYAEAEQRARSVLEAQPRNARGHAVLAITALMQGRPAEGLGHAQDALRTERVDARLHFIAAACLAAMGKLEEAIAGYRRALQYRPQFTEARANLGYVLEQAGRPAEAADCYRAVLDARPTDWFCLNRLGYCERILGRPQAAATLLQRALEIRPDFAATANELALAYLNADRKAEAIAAFRRAVDMDPAFLSAWCNLGKVLYLEHVVAEGEGAAADPAPVLECFDRILALDPQNVEFRYLRDCVAGVRLERPPDAYIESFFDRFAARFDEKLVGELRYGGPQAAEEFLRPWLAGRSGLRVVDLGCGTGLSGGFLRAAAARLAGVDLSAAMLEQARARAIYDELAREEIGAWLERCEAGGLDLAVALEVFNYVGNLAPVLGAAARALKPGARMVFSIELAADPAAGFVLLPAGRYAHSTAYVEAEARAAGLEIAASREIVMRYEANKPVRAFLFALEKPAA